MQSPNATVLWDSLVTGTFKGKSSTEKRKHTKEIPKKINGNSHETPVATPVEVTTAIILLIDETHCVRCNHTSQSPTKLMVRKRVISAPNKTEHYESVTLAEAYIARKATIRNFGEYPRWKTKTLKREIEVCCECFNDIALEEVMEEGT